MPSSIECLDAYNLPWAAIRHKREFGNVSLVAGYRTDFPTAYVERLLSPYIGSWAEEALDIGGSSAHILAAGLPVNFAIAPTNMLESSIPSSTKSTR